jgi:hypothetical protein
MPGIYFSFVPSQFFNVRLAFNFGKLEGADSVIDGKGGLEESRSVRNQHFKSPIMELFVAGEIYPTVLFEEDADDVWHKFRPYGVLGIGAFRFNPKAQYVDLTENRTVDLKPLRQKDGHSSPESQRV